MHSCFMYHNIGIVITTIPILTKNECQKYSEHLAILV